MQQPPPILFVIKQSFSHNNNPNTIKTTAIHTFINTNMYIPATSWFATSITTNDNLLYRLACKNYPKNVLEEDIF